MPSPPKACNALLTCTLWFNVIFYALLACFARHQTPARWARWLGAALHALPVWVVSRYVVQVVRLGSRCGRPPYIVIIGDILFHWLPLGVTLLVLYRHSSDEEFLCVQPSLWTALGALGVLALPLAGARAAWGGARALYHVPGLRLLRLYAPALLLAWALFRAPPFPSIIV